MSTYPYIVLSVALFIIGAVGILTRRNAIFMLLSIEIMLNAGNLAFVAFSRLHGNLTGQIVALFVMTVAAAEVAVGLAIIVLLYRSRGTLRVDEANLLKW